MSATTVETQLEANVITLANSLTNPAKKIVVTLNNFLLPESALKETPSQTDGLDIETETDLRILGCEMIQTSGILLNLPQEAIATAQIYFQRFYYSKSFVRHPVGTTAMASIYLASKVEEQPSTIRDVINVFHQITKKEAQKIISPLIIDQNYMILKSEVIRAERNILKQLGFCVQVKHPHKLILLCLYFLQYEEHHGLMQLAWNCMDDALRTDVFMRFPPETIACACIYLTARRICLPLPNNPYWFRIFKITEEDIKEICTSIMKLYKRTKVNPEELMRKVEGIANKLIQPQEEQQITELEENEAESPTASTSIETSTLASKNEKPPIAPRPLRRFSIKKSNKERRSRLRNRELYRSRERRQDEKSGRVRKRSFLFR